jgi:hypothetical protein
VQLFQGLFQKGVPVATWYALFCTCSVGLFEGYNIAAVVNDRMCTTPSCRGTVRIIPAGHCCAAC